MVSPAAARSQKRCGVCHWPTTLLTALTTSGAFGPVGQDGRRACPTAGRGCDRVRGRSSSRRMASSDGVVAGGLGEAGVDDELVGALGDVEDVLERPEQGFGAPASGRAGRGRTRVLETDSRHAAGLHRPWRKHPADRVAAASTSQVSRPLWMGADDVTSRDRATPQRGPRPETPPTSLDHAIQVDHAIRVDRGGRGRQEREDGVRMTRAHDADPAGRAVHRLRPRRARLLRGPRRSTTAARTGRRTGASTSVTSRRPCARSPRTSPTSSAWPRSSARTGTCGSRPTRGPTRRTRRWPSRAAARST